MIEGTRVTHGKPASGNEWSGTVMASSWDTARNVWMLLIQKDRDGSLLCFAHSDVKAANGRPPMRHPISLAAIDVSASIDALREQVELVREAMP